MKNSFQIKMGAIVSYIAIIINIVASLIYIPWMVNSIGKSDYALYTLATSFISIFMVDFGLSSAVARFVAKYNSEEQNEKIDVLLSTIERMYLIIDIIILIVLGVVFLCLDSIYSGLTASELIKYKELYLIVGLYSIASFPFMPLNGILNAYELFIQLKVCDLAQKLISILLTVVCLLNNLGVTSIVVMNAISGLTIIFIKIFILKKKKGFSIRIKYFDNRIAMEILKFSLWVTVISICQRFIFNLAPTILGMVSSSEDIALFAPANTLESCFFSFASAVNGIFLPTISRMVSKGEMSSINALMVRIGRYQMFILGYIFVGFLCIGDVFIVAWMGEEFINSYICAIFLFIPDILIFSQQIANTTAVVKNKVKELSFAYIAMAITCTVLSFFLCRKWGAIGSSVSIAGAYFILFIILNYIYYKVVGLDIKGFFQNTYLKLGPPLIIVSVMCFIICKQISLDNSIYTMILRIAILSIVYLLYLMLCLSKDEKTQIAGYIKSIMLKIRKM